MLCNTSHLPDNASELKELVLTLQQDYEAQIDRLHEQIRLLRSKLFGRKTEKYVDAGQDQLRLFDEIEQAASRKEENRQEVPVAAHTRKKCGRKPLPGSKGKQGKQGDGHAFMRCCLH